MSVYGPWGEFNGEERETIQELLRECLRNTREEGRESDCERSKCKTGNAKEGVSDS